MLVLPSGEERFSSFGVACELFRRRYPDWLTRDYVELVAAGYRCGEYRSQNARPERFHLPEVVYRWLGLADSVGTLHADFAFLGHATLGDWEDDDAESFRHLADVIDAEAIRFATDSR